MVKQKQNPPADGKKTATAKLNHLRISPRKVRAVADIIRGLPIQEAEAQLMLSPRRPSGHLLKLIRSAAKNAENNNEMNPRHLYIKEIRIDEGPVLKRWRARAFGSIGEIRKRTSHISLVLGEKEEMPKERFIFPKPKDKSKEESKKEKKKTEKEKEKKPEARPQVKPQRKAEKPKERKSPFRKIFRRKSI